ncbi:MAG: methylated-DNA--[protein]-cysteine S-methyltransferase [Candidatus Saccharibacteria bacterium]|nr:methylated-DNA--[protein]-cysteine S-methyltransferase [Candidatus Saccharibacteria bacterium]
MKFKAIHTSHYQSPVGDILLASRNDKLIGLWIEGQKHYLSKLSSDNIIQSDDDPTILKAKTWLDNYFDNKRPSVNDLDLAPIGNDFAIKVWQILRQITYGQTITYGEIARKIALADGKSKMSAQAVGNAVGRNPISIIIPCHRVLDTNRQLTGYAGGLDIKKKLLEHEHILFVNQLI